MIPLRGFGPTGMVETPIPIPNPFLGNTSDANITWLTSFGLARTPHTPRRQRLVDMVGEEVIGNLPHLLSELKIQLQALGPNKLGRTGPSSLATLTGISQQGLVTFKCNRVGYQKALTLVDFCHCLATVQNACAPAVAPEALMAGVHVSIQAMEERMEEAPTEPASTLSKAIDSLKTNNVLMPHRTLTQATHHAPAQEANTIRPNSVKPAKAQPELTLSQARADGRAEIDTKVSALAGHINFATQEVCSSDPPVIRALRCVHRTGDIVFQSSSAYHTL